MKIFRSSLIAAVAMSLAACSAANSTNVAGTPMSSESTSAAETNTSPSTSDTSDASSGAASAYEDSGTGNLVTATTTDLGDTSPHAPEDLAKRLNAGGLVIIHRYTGATRPAQTEEAPAGFIDDGQRISEASVERMRQLAAKYQELAIPVASALSSEYYFVYQHADEAMEVPVKVNRDLTGSLNFDDGDELEKSLQGLRNRVITPPPTGTNTVLFTHQGKFDKAFGFYLEPGWTLVFQPNGSGIPQLIASMALDDFLALRPNT